MHFSILSVFVFLTDTNLVHSDGTSGGNGDEGKRYLPDWSNLATRPLPEWYDRAKIGIFIHWGVYSVPSYGPFSEWFWANWRASENNEMYIDFMKNNYPPGFSYEEFAPMFTAEFFDPDAWAELFEKAGAKYVVLTSKHHEGFTLFPAQTAYTWNSVRLGPKRDIVTDLSIAVRNHNLKFGVYYSLLDWYNLLYYNDSQSNFKTRTYIERKIWPDIMQLVNYYRPSVLWVDGDWDAREDYWGPQELLAWLYNVSPVKDEVVVNDRWGNGTRGKHGDFYVDYLRTGVLLKRKWENTVRLDSQSWGYRRTIKVNEVLSISQLMYEIVSSISAGGNALINVGPTKEGIIIPIFQERLLMLGEWLSINGEAIYGSSPWYSQNDTLNGNVWYTCQKRVYSPNQQFCPITNPYTSKKLEPPFAGWGSTNPTATPTQLQDVLAMYAIVLKWPKGNVLRLKDAVPPVNQTTQSFEIEMLGYEGEYLPWKITKMIVEITLPDIAAVKSKYAWTLKFTIT